MSEVRYIVNFRFGSVQMGSPTGRWVQDPDGWWREIWTDTVWLDQHGQVYRREPFEALIRMNMPPEDAKSTAPLGWLQRLFKPGKGK